MTDLIVETRRRAAPAAQEVTMLASTRNDAIATTPPLIVQLAGDWFDWNESSQLFCAPRLWVDDSGQMWVAVGEAEEAQRVRAVEHLHSLPLVIVTAADEIFILSSDDYARMV